MANDLGDFIRTEVGRAEADFVSFRSKALSVVVLSGGIVALVTGFLSVAAGSAQDILPSGARWLVVAAMLAFVFSTACALIMNLPSDVTASDEGELGPLVEDHWADDSWDRQVALLQVDYLISLRAANASSARWLVAAISLEIAGIALTACMALVIVVQLA